MLKPVANSVLETATQEILCQIMRAYRFAHVKLWMQNTLLRLVGVTEFEVIAIPSGQIGP
jgi:hypothetical protein